MAEYINKQELLKEIDDLKKSPWYNDGYGFGLQQARHDGVNCVVDLCIKQAPSADVVEVVHGEWKGIELKDTCSICNRSISEICDADSYIEVEVLSELIACPFCGAKMNGERRSENES